MGVKVYVSGISGNKEVKKRQQRVFMILDSKNIPYDAVDIAEPGREADRDFMQNNSTSSGATVSDTNPRHPLPPQIFNDQEYCGDYDQFDLANEVDTLEQFLKVEVPVQNNEINSHEVSSHKKLTANEVIANNVDGIIERIETNGIASSRETSVESEKKSNGDEKANEVETTDVDGEAEPQEDPPNEHQETEAQNESSPSEDLINSEQAASED